MGYWSDRQLEDTARGWSRLYDKTVCPAHIGEEAVKGIVAVESSETRCSYCRNVSRRPIAVHLDRVIGYIHESITAEYTDAGELPVDEGEVLFETPLSTWEVLFNEGFEADDQVFDDIVATLGDLMWCRRDWQLLPPHRRMELGWENFKAVVQRRRFTFWSVDGDPGDPEHMSPHQILDLLAEGLPELVTTVSTGHAFFRARAHMAERVYRLARDLGPPPAHVTGPGRMNAEGVALFYGAEDAETAVAEVLSHASAAADTVTVGTFLSQRPLRVLDLAAIPPIPSLFDDEGRDRRPFLRFMAHFAADIARPRRRSTADYAPAQIVTEYIRYDVKDPWGHSVDGVVYRSSVMGGDRCVALFTDAQACGDLGSTTSEPRSLLLDPASVHRRPIPYAASAS